MSLFYPQVTHQIGGNTAGATANISSGTYLLAGGNNITLSQNANSVTISHQPPVLSFWQNMEGGNSNSINWLTQTVYFVPLDVGENVFAGHMTAKTVLLNVSGFTLQTNSGSLAVTVNVGLYTISASTKLNLLNSASTTWSLAAATNNSLSFQGPRWLSLDASLFSTQLSLTQTNYVLGLHLRQTANSNSAPRLAFIGQSYFGSQNRSGTLDAASTSATSLGWGLPFLGVYSASSSVLPGVVAYSEISKAGAAGNFAQHFIFNNLTNVL